jgi:PAS domain S-box-containing protein
LQLTLNRSVIGLACYALAGGLVSFSGWVLDLPRLTDWNDTGISIQPNTTLAVLFAGTGLLLLAYGKLRASAVFGSLVAAIAGATLFEWLSGLDLGIDAILLLGRTWGRVGVVVPGRMGPPAAVSWTLIGIALALATRGREARRYVPSLALATLCISALSVIGYAYGASVLYTLPRLTVIALQTSTFILAVSLGLIMSVPERSPTRRMLEDSVAGALIRRAVPILIVVPILLGFLRLEGQRAGFYDLEFGTGFRTLVEIVLLLALLWWTAETVSRQARNTRKTEQDVRDREQLLAAVTENTKVGLVVFDRDHRYVYANRSYLDVLGLAEEDIAGRRVAELLPEANDDQIRPRFERAFAGERVEDELKLPALADGDTERYFAVVYEPQMENGVARNVIVTVADVTERKRAEAALQRTSELKDEFLATLSHELRTPLHAILGWVRVLEKRPSDPALTNEGIQVISRNARAQADLIADLLDMSRIISGKIRLEIADVTLSEVIRKAIETIAPAAESKGIQVAAALDATAATVRGDASRLQQVLWNLLSNAVKFTPKGGRIDVGLKKSGSHVEIVVRDSGAGIPAKFLPHIFDRFRQGDASTTREHGGLGLGLAIVKQLVELHGGTVQGDSEGEGRGATFTIRLPLTAVRARSTPPKEGTPAPHEHAENVDLEGITVLAVEDQADARQLLRLVLERSHARVFTAGSVDEALLVLELAKPAIILCDIGMPGKDGYDFITELRRRKNDTPALAVTAFARAEDKLRALRAGYHGHIAKPIEPAELISAVAVFAKAGRH